MIIASASAIFLLASLLFRGFNLDYLSAGVTATGRTNMMRQFRAVALRAIVYRRKRQPKMATPFTLTCLSIFSLW